MAMHILQLGPYPPPEGGISRNMLAIREELLERGDQCSIIATSESSRTADEPGVYHPRSAFGLLRLLATLRFDVLHLHIGGEVTARVLALAFACTIFGRGKSVLTLHSGGYPQTEAAKNAKPSSIAGFVFRRFRRLIAVNENIADVFRRFGVPDESIDVILPFSLKQPSPDVNVPDDLAAFCSSHTPLLLAVGGLEKDYDPLLQIEALGDVLQKLPGAGLMIVGGGSMLAEAESAVAATGYAEHIMLAGDVEHAVVLHLIRDADILLRTTLFDGDAISVREALYLGTPVIATNNGMRPEGVHLIKSGDNFALSHKITAISEERNAPRHNATIDASNINQVLDIYDSVIGYTG